MVWGAVIGAAIGVAGSMMGASGEEKAAKKRRQFGIMETEEEIRRKTNEHEYTLGYNRAQVGGSGVQKNSLSVQQYTMDMESEFGKQTDWMRYAASTGFKSDMADTKNRGRGAQISSFANLAGAVGDAWGSS